MLWWLRQNTIVYAHDRLEGNPTLGEELAEREILSVVHGCTETSEPQMNQLCGASTSARGLDLSPPLPGK